jgi:hypothetical protein
MSPNETDQVQTASVFNMKPDIDNGVVIRHEAATLFNTKAVIDQRGCVGITAKA